MANARIFTNSDWTVTLPHFNPSNFVKWHKMKIEINVLVAIILPQLLHIFLLTK